MARKSVKDLHNELMASDEEYREEYEALEQEFSIARAAISARKHANLTQKELADLMDTSQQAIARIEGGHLPSMRTLERLAAATGTHLKVSFESLR